MKTFLSISFATLSLLFLLQAGLFWVLAIQRDQQRAEIRQRMIEGFHAWELVLLEIPKSVEAGNDGSFKRVHAREFEYRNQLYDIVEEQSFDDVTWYLVFPDNKETRLKAQIKKLIREGQEKGAKPLLERLLKVSTHWISNENPSVAFRERMWSVGPRATRYLFVLKEFDVLPVGHPPCCE